MEATVPVNNKPYPINAIRQAFPILSEKIHGKPLVYLDNAASTQKVLPVLDKINDFYCHDYANIHRGVHQLSERSTLAYEKARKITQQFMGAALPQEIIFTRGTTEGINLVAASYVKALLQPGDEVLISAVEHHANIVPWQMLAKETGAVLKVIPVDDHGDITLDAFTNTFSHRTKFVALTHISNAIGSVIEVKPMIDYTHQQGATILIDGAQAAPHMPLDMQALNADFYVFSGHKVYGPTGIGVLYAQKKHHEQMQPYQTGGGMIETVSFESSTFASVPQRFEAGTPNIAGAIGLGEALNYLMQVGLSAIYQHEKKCLDYAVNKLTQISDFQLIGTPKNRAAVISFNIADIHAHDVSTILDTHGIATRAGHHCAMPLMKHYKVPATVRASLGMYNTESEIDILCEAILALKKLFQL